MPADANLTLQASVTKTATFNGAWVPIPGLAGHAGLYAHVFFSAADQAVALSTTAQAGEIVIPFELRTKGVRDGSNPSVRLTCTIAGAGSTPTVTYSGDVRPAIN